MEDEDLNGVNLKIKYAFYYRLNEEGLSRDMKANEFADQVKLISYFSSLEEFWAIFQHLRKPDNCRSGTELFMFLNDVKPYWEDPLNINGGKVSIRLRKNYSSIIWEEFVLAVLGEIFPSNIQSEITGVVISIRKECNVLQLWFKDYTLEKGTLIEQAVKELIMVPDSVEVETKQFFKAPVQSKINIDNNQPSNNIEQECPKPAIIDSKPEIIKEEPEKNQNELEIKSNVPQNVSTEIEHKEPEVEKITITSSKNQNYTYEDSIEVNVVKYNDQRSITNSNYNSKSSSNYRGKGHKYYSNNNAKYRDYDENYGYETYNDYSNTKSYDDGYGKYKKTKKHK